ncbi:hypothetical protein T484DRAFT_1765798, partial [Baffinella frigidus]
SGYIGRQLWASVIAAILVYIPTGFILWASVIAAILVYIPTGFIVLPLVWGPTRDFLFRWMALPSAGLAPLVWGPTRDFLFLWMALPSAGLAVMEFGTFTLRSTINRLATDGHYIWSRTMFGWYDFVGSYLHFVTGFSLALFRLIFNYIDFALTFGRLDIPVIESGRQNWDTGHAAFMAVLYLDFIYNAPVTSVLANALAQEMYRRREREEVLTSETAGVAAVARRAASHQNLTHLKQSGGEEEVLTSETAGAAAVARRATSHQKRQASHQKRQVNRGQFLFTVARNPTLAARRILPPTPLNPWDDADDDLDMDLASDDGDGVADTWRYSAGGTRPPSTAASTGFQAQISTKERKAAAKLLRQGSQTAIREAAQIGSPEQGTV